MVLERFRGMIAFSSLKVKDFLSINGIEQNVLKVYNATGGQLIAGDLVYISGYDATLEQFKVTKADADYATKSACLVILETIENANSGKAAMESIVSGLNTNAAAAVGDPVYLSSTAGGWTVSAPTGADQIVQEVGVVTVKSATVGKIRFYPGKRIISSLGSSGLQSDAVTKTKLAGGFNRVTLANGTASATDVTVSGMAVGDELVAVLSFTTAAAIASVADRTSEYVIASGKLTKAAGTNETSNQLVVFWNDLT